MLGIDSDVVAIREPSDQAKYAIDLQAGFYCLYVYCDLVESQVLGKQRVPLLRIVLIEGNFGNMINKAQVFRC